MAKQAQTQRRFYLMINKILSITTCTAIAVMSAIVMAQAPPAGAGGAKGGPGGGGGKGGGGRGPAGPVLSVTSSAFPDGGEIPMHFSGRGDSKSPAFEFHWFMGVMPAAAPDALKTYAIVFHDIENSTAKGTTDTLHWSAFNIPGTITTLPEGLGAGVLADGTTNGPGIRGGAQGTYFGPGAGPGPFHHYVFEFYALDTKLDLQGTATRDELMKAMEGHVIGKAAYVGRFHAPPAQ
jgi:Raf kinase inhibitor-like YbhB/YbcL family protein